MSSKKLLYQKELELAWRKLKALSALCFVLLTYFKCIVRTKSKRTVHFAVTSQLILMPNADRNWYSAADKAKAKAKFKRETLQHTQQP